MLQYLHNPFSKGRVEVFKNQVRIRFADSAFAGVGNIVPEKDIV